MDVIFLRHGQTPGNKEGRYIGTTDEGLSLEGREKLKSIDLPILKKVEFVYQSPMLRCKESSQILFPNCESQVVNDLRECNFGEFEYKNYEELSGNEAYQRWLDSGGRIAFPKGESRDAFVRRCLAGFEAIMNHAFQSAYETIGVVAHGGTIMAILHGCSEPQKEFYDWQTKNGSGFAAKLEEDTWKQGIHKLYDIEKFGSR